MRKEKDMEDNQTTMNTAESEVPASEQETLEESGEDTSLENDGDGFTDTEGDASHGKAKQSSEQNAKNAQRRRDAESAQLKKAREDAILMALKNKNPYTGEEMKDSEDVREYLAMREIEDGGGDPLKDFQKHQKQKAREERAARENVESVKQTLRDQLEQFREQEPDVDIKQLLADKSFREYADGKLGGEKSLTEIYRSYKSFVGELTGKAKEDKKAAQATANKKAGVGSLSSSSKTATGYYTPEQVRAMSREEVHEHYDDIKKSMKKWK